MPTIVRSSQAEQDIGDIWLFIAEDDEAAANRVKDRLLEVFRMLAANPGAGRARDEIRKGLRSYPVSNYIVFYRVWRDGIIVARVLHGARDLPRLF
jgi:toxin ParE1/3/4